MADTTRQQVRLPDEAGAGARQETLFLARYVLADETEVLRIRGRVSHPAVLAHYQEVGGGPTLSDDPARLKHWLYHTLDRPQTVLPGTWAIDLNQ